MKFKSQNLLVTGGAGFIGSHFIKYLLNKYNSVNVINLDLLTYAGDLNNTQEFMHNDNYKFIHGDICDNLLLKKVFEKYKIDGVINFAAESHVDNSIVDPSKFIKTNINGIYCLLNTALNFWMNSGFKYKKEFVNSRFHQISTDEVYGSILTGSFDENSHYKPNSPYSASKASADMIIRSFNKTYGLNTTISISSNNYGLNQNVEKLIPKVIKAICNNSAINLYGDGMNVRNWLHVDDHCSAIDLIYNLGKSPEIYNVSGKNELSNIALIKKIYFLYNKIDKKNKNKLRINYIDDRLGHDRRYSLKSKKISNDLGWFEKNNFENGLIELIKNEIN
tara:strand:+ start:765 stop:1769 length:1005 start_codon:yes stop_codon:yes gene_type:complete